MERVAKQCGLAVSVPLHQIQPRIVVVFGQIMVFLGDKTMLHTLRAWRTLRQLCKRSSGVLPPQYKSSASLARTRSCTCCSRSPQMRHISSSSTVSDPGIPMADRVYRL